jgi:hypothetical protein
MRVVPLLEEAVALIDTEFVLFVDDGEAEGLEVDVVAEEGVCADSEICRAGGDGIVGFLLFGGRYRTCEKGDIHTESVE